MLLDLEDKVVCLDTRLYMYTDLWVLALVAAVDLAYSSSPNSARPALEL